MTDFHVNLHETTKGHSCVIGPTIGGMTTGNRTSPMTKVEMGFSDEEGWTATTHILAHTFTGHGSNAETALYDLKAKVDEIFWSVHELRDEISRMATNEMNEEPST